MPAATCQTCSSKKTARQRVDGRTLCNKCYKSDSQNMSEDGTSSDDGDITVTEMYAFRTQDAGKTHLTRDADQSHAFTFSGQESPKLRQNELLCYIQYQLHRVPKESLIKSVLINFNPEEIAEAKSMLISIYSADGVLKTNRTGNSAHKRELDDIISKFQELDSNDNMEKVVFCAVNLGRIPSHQPEQMNLTAILDRLQMLEGKVSHIEQDNKTNTNDIEALKQKSLPSFRDIVNGTAVTSTPKDPIKTANNRSDVTPVPQIAPSLNVAKQRKNDSDTTDMHAIKENTTTSDEQNTDGFLLPSNQRKQIRRKQAKSVRGDLSHETIKGAPRLRHLFVYKVQPTTDDKALESFLSGRITLHYFRKVSHENAWLKSFRIGISPEDEDKIMRNEFWPKGIACKRFRFPVTRQNISQKNNQNG